MCWLLRWVTFHDGHTGLCTSVCICTGICVCMPLCLVCLLLTVCGCVFLFTLCRGRWFVCLGCRVGIACIPFAEAAHPPSSHTCLSTRHSHPAEAPRPRQ